MTAFYCKEPAAGERHVYTTEAEAMEELRQILDDHSREATLDGEWMRDIEDVSMGFAGVDEDSDFEDDVATYRIKLVGSKRRGYEAEIVKVEPVLVSAPAMV